ncbi:carbohydrate ABC transporter substrate-binding protein (CUT1 family) [Saccharothrix carnea]|uniref:Carbohydrate ABC transporter substrate-binding protein (CUT1 family) n=1 Tax=Saccharothrix carnea TaxID=1280637 RepID=A0A2P8I1Y8_SACCR|nr:extracellular solute-binding protein [Saccharothrix carnea]PSL52468.1 carbohydrate ABC transporter substrate-binding protein (CUT1 family) [Saccharothrix carnea]
MGKFRAGVAAAAVVLVAACGSDGTDTGADGKIEGKITVLTNRTDLVDTKFKEYAEQFKQLHPDVEVVFEGITDYDNEVKIRMSTDNYGDVLLIPNSITSLSDLPDYFEPLGSVSELGQKYRFVTEKAFEDKVYGLAVTGNAFGFAYNKKVWAAAGVDSPPTTPEDFLDALEAIKDKTDAVPLYTNYRNGWPLTQWQDARGSVSADPQVSNKMAADDSPWAEGKTQHTIDSLLFDVVANKLTEDDPLTTDWESSKSMIGTGQIATMMLGSWSITQLRAAAPNKDDIGYLPFPVQVDGKFHSAIAGDYKNGINIHSKNKDTARAWVDWFAEKSNFATAEGGISPLKDGPEPDTLADFAAAGVEYFEVDHAQDAVVTKIDDAAEIGLYEQTYRQGLVDAARGASGKSKQDVFDDLNTRWAEAKALVTK